jgi:aspartate/methionine/tyrosine aminotransferase
MTRLSVAASKMRPGVFAELQKKVDERVLARKPLVGLHIGDTHLSPPQGARISALAADLDADHNYRYGATAGLPELRADLAAHLANSRRVPGLTADNILLGAGGTHALFCVAKAVLDPGDDVIVFAPYWPLAHGIFTSVGASVIELPVSQRAYDESALDLGGMLASKVTPRTRAIYFVSPNNPDGKVLRREDLATILAFAEKHDLFVFADEVYADISYEQQPISFGSLPGAMERSALLYSFSKSHALAGARIGYVASSKEVVAAARRVSVHTVFNVPIASQRAARAALHTGAEFLGTALNAYAAAREETCAALTRMEGVRFHRPDGATYVFCDFSERLGGKELSFFLERCVEQGVLLAPGESFGESFRTHARICFSSVGRHDLAEGLAALGRALSEL